MSNLIIVLWLVGSNDVGTESWLVDISVRKLKTKIQPNRDYARVTSSVGIRVQSPASLDRQKSTHVMRKVCSLVLPKIKRKNLILHLFSRRSFFSIHCFSLSWFCFRRFLSSFIFHLFIFWWKVVITIIISTIIISTIIIVIIVDQVCYIYSKNALCYLAAWAM